MAYNALHDLEQVLFHNVPKLTKVLLRFLKVPRDFLYSSRSHSMLQNCSYIDLQNSSYWGQLKAWHS